MAPDIRNNTLKNAAIDFIAGSLGGISMVYVGQPLDTVKVKMQTFPSLYGGMVDCCRQTFLKEGITRGLYAGTVPAVMANVAEKSVLFVAYGSCQRIIMKIKGVQRPEDLGTFSKATAGSLSALFTSVTLCPAELIKCKLQAMREVQLHALPAGQQVEKIGPLRLVRRILQHEGFPGMFRGFSSTLSREMLGNWFFFGSYEGARYLLSPATKTKEDIGLVRTMLSGAIAGVVYWTVVFPADVVKSRIQVGGLTDPMLSVIIRTARQEGVSSLYNGLRPTLVRTIPATGTLFVVYEYSKEVMHNCFT